MNIDFESFLMERMVENGHQDIDDAFWDWVQDLPSENIIEYANDYAKQVSKQAMTMAK